MQAFHAHGEAYSRIEAEALKLALHGPESKEKPARGDEDDEEDDYDDDEAKMQVYHDMLDELGTHITPFRPIDSFQLTEAFVM